VPPRKKTAAAPPPLTDADVAALKSRVQAGEKPRVVVRTASAAVPAGTRGNIVRVGNPSEGEYVVVRLGKDEVPFAPAELAVSGRAAKTVAVPAPMPGRKKPATKAPAKPSAAAATPAKAASPRAPKRTARGRRSTSRRALPPLVVTLRFTDGTWTVEASRGARRLAKAAPVRPGAVKAFADLVDETVVRDALTETIESCRSVVEERAAALRAELVAAEAALKEYDARRR
jgi:hypothetical protein